MGEIAAIVVAQLAADPTTPTEIRSDSMCTINGLNKHLDAWENMGWVGLRNATWFQYAAYLLRVMLGLRREQFVPCTRSVARGHIEREKERRG
jgi:ribonuclease HI